MEVTKPTPSSYYDMRDVYQYMRARGVPEVEAFLRDDFVDRELENGAVYTLRLDEYVDDVAVCALRAEFGDVIELRYYW